MAIIRLPRTQTAMEALTQTGVAEKFMANITKLKQQRLNREISTEYARIDKDAEISKSFILNTAGPDEAEFLIRQVDQNVREHKLAILNRSGIYQPKPYPSGVKGFMRKIFDTFDPTTTRNISDTPLTEALKGQMIAEPFQQTEQLSPSQQISAERLRLYRETGDEKFISPSLVNIQTGQRLLTGDQRQNLADKQYKEEMALSATAKNTARKSVKTIISQLSHGTWAGDMKFSKNYKRSNLIEGYKHYRTENSYKGMIPENQKDLDDIWDSQMTVYNKAGYEDHGKNEFDWNPTDPKVKSLRASGKSALSGELGTLQRPGGGVSTEISITVTDKRLNGGKPTNIPLLVRGQTGVDTLLAGKKWTKQQEEVAVKRAVARVAQGETLPSYGTIAEAVKAAKARSAAKAPTGLEDLWPELSSNDRQKIRQSINQGYTAEQIRQAIK